MHDWATYHELYFTYRNDLSGPTLSILPRLHQNMFPQSEIKINRSLIFYSNFTVFRLKTASVARLKL